MQHIFSLNMFSSFSATRGLWPPPTCDMGYSKQDPLEELLELKDGDLGQLGWLDAHDESLRKNLMKEDEAASWWLISWWLMDGDHDWSRLIMMLHATIHALAGADFQTDRCTVTASWNRGQRLPQWFLEPSWSRVEGVSIKSQASPWICVWHMKDYQAVQAVQGTYS